MTTDMPLSSSWLRDYADEHEEKSLNYTSSHHIYRKQWRWSSQGQMQELHMLGMIQCDYMCNEHIYYQVIYLFWDNRHNCISSNYWQNVIVICVDKYATWYHPTANICGTRLWPSPGTAIMLVFHLSDLAGNQPWQMTLLVYAPVMLEWGNENRVWSMNGLELVSFRCVWVDWDS